MVRLTAIFLILILCRLQTGQTVHAGKPTLLVSIDRVYPRRAVSLAVGDLREELGSADGAFCFGSALAGSATDGFASTS